MQLVQMSMLEGMKLAMSQIDAVLADLKTFAAGHVDIEARVGINDAACRVGRAWLNGFKQRALAVHGMEVRHRACFRESVALSCDEPELLLTRRREFSAERCRAGEGVLVCGRRDRARRV